MTFQPIPAASIAGMVFTLVVTTLLPILLCVVACRKLKRKPAAIFLGCVSFVLFALILEQSLHSIVLSNFTIQQNIWLYCVYGSAAAALFEETGRYVLMKYRKNPLDEKDAVLFGLGHGGIEAILVVGVTYLNNLTYAIMIQSGQMDAALAGLDVAAAADAVASVSPLWTLPSYQFFIAGVERVLTLGLQVALSMLVFQAVQRKRIVYYLAAMAVHFSVNFITLAAAQFIAPIYVEGILVLLVAAAGYAAWQVTRKNRVLEK